MLSGFRTCCNEVFGGFVASVANLFVRHLCDDLEEKVTRSLREEVTNFNGVHAQMLERSNMKVTRRERAVGDRTLGCFATPEYCSRLLFCAVCI